MTLRSRNSRLALSALAFAGVVAALVCAGPALADSSSPPPHLITVSGQGEVKAAPDSAQLSAGVTVQAATAAQALAANSRAMNQVFATLKRAGIPEKSIQTSNFSVSPQYAQYKPGTSGPQRIVGYEVSNTVEVTVDDLAKVGPTLDALVASGANQIGGISFSIRDPKPLLREARAEAVKDAIDRAQTYAQAAGVSLGAIVSINEGGAETPRPMYRVYAMAAPAAPPPIAAGENSVSASVSITWEIR